MCIHSPLVIWTRFFLERSWTEFERSPSSQVSIASKSNLFYLYISLFSANKNCPGQRSRLLSFPIMLCSGLSSLSSLSPHPQYYFYPQGTEPNAASCISLIRGHPHGWKPLKPLSPLSGMISELHPCTGECDDHIDFFFTLPKDSSI